MNKEFYFKYAIFLCFCGIMYSVLGIWATPTPIRDAFFYPWLFIILLYFVWKRGT